VKGRRKERRRQEVRKIGGWKKEGEAPPGSEEDRWMEEGRRGAARK
jgi:hypothetical protein